MQRRGERVRYSAQLILIPLVQKKQNKADAADKAEGRFLHVVDARAPHLKPFAANRREADKIQAKDAGQ